MSPFKILGWFAAGLLLAAVVMFLTSCGQSGDAGPPQATVNSAPAAAVQSIAPQGQAPIIIQQASPQSGNSFWTDMMIYHFLFGGSSGGGTTVINNTYHTTPSSTVAGAQSSIRKQDSQAASTHTYKAYTQPAGPRYAPTPSRSSSSFSSSRSSGRR